MYFLSYVCCIVGVAIVFSNTEKIRLWVVFYGKRVIKKIPKKFFGKIELA